ncbi:hypothetical protein GCM10009716_28050 [Streptomyces sodiiphilus]|uniref:Phosphodiesterase n=1 Tax=Streptomyces sodiiphilus TaxID=226217 RepID=A0ABP5AM93_9ACTN
MLARLDRCVADILGATGYAPRPYHLVLLSDHGQSPGEPFADAFGERLEDVVQRGCGRPVPRQIRHPETGAEARGTARAALHRPEEPPVPEPAGAQGAGRRAPVVLGSGNLGLVSFPEIQGRASRETLEGSYPQLLRTLTGHPGIGFVLVHSRVHGPVVLGPGGSEHRLRTGEVLGPDPLAPFGPYAAAVVRRTAGFRNVPDLMVNSAVDPATGAVHAFEDQIGSHGGLGGEQSRAFLLSPLALSEADAEGPLTGAESVHRMLRRWLREAAEEPRERDTPWADGAASPAGPSPHA